MRIPRLRVGFCQNRGPLRAKFDGKRADCGRIHAQLGRCLGELD